MTAVEEAAALKENKEEKKREKEDAGMKEAEAASQK